MRKYDKKYDDKGNILHKICFKRKYIWISGFTHVGSTIENKIYKKIRNPHSFMPFAYNIKK